MVAKLQILKRSSLLVLLTALLFSCLSIKTRDDIANEYYNLANDYYKLENYSRAIELYKKSLEHNPTLTQSKLNLIYAYQKSKNYREALTFILKEYKEDNSEYSRKLLLLLGNNYFLQGDYQRSLKLFSEYIKSFPDDHLGYFNLALSQLRTGDREEAIANFLKAHEKKSDFVPALFNIASYYDKEGNSKDSLYYYKKLLEVEKSNHLIYYQFAQLEYRLEEYEDAARHFEEASKLKPEEPEYYLWLAKIYAKAYKSKKKSLEYLEKSLENGYKDPDALRSIEEFSTLKKFSEFEALLKKYLSK